MSKLAVELGIQDYAATSTMPTSVGIVGYFSGHFRAWHSSCHTGCLHSRRWTSAWNTFPLYILYRLQVCIIWSICLVFARMYTAAARSNLAQSTKDIFMVYILRVQKSWCKCKGIWNHPN